MTLLANLDGSSPATARAARYWGRKQRAAWEALDKAEDT
jgi:hypothetical protein